MKTADKKNIFEIANRLDKAGKKPTLIAVRKELGGGSYSTIQPILVEWKKERNGTPKEDISSVPEEIKTAFESACTEIWNASKERAEQELMKVSTAHDLQIKELTSEKEELINEVTSLEKKLNASEAKVNEGVQSIEDLKKENQRLSVIENEYHALSKKFEERLIKLGQLEGELKSIKDIKETKK